MEYTLLYLIGVFSIPLFLRAVEKYFPSNYQSKEEWTLDGERGFMLFLSLAFPLTYTIMFFYGLGCFLFWLYEPNYKETEKS